MRCIGHAGLIWSARSPRVRSSRSLLVAAGDGSADAGSAYLHSATMVKAGGVPAGALLARAVGTEWWFWLVGGTGALTLLFGAYVAMFQNDLKRLLAYRRSAPSA